MVKKIINKFSNITNEDAFDTPVIDNEYPFWICEYGHTYSDKDYHEISKNSSLNRIEYVISGKGYITSKNSTCVVNSGDTYILHEGDDHNYYSDTSTPMDKIWINVKGVLAREIIKIYHLEDIILFKNINSEKWIREIHDICKNTKDPHEIQSKVSAMFLNYVQFLAEQYTITQSKVDFLDDMRTFIDLHIQDNITLEQLSAISQKSPDHTIRLFKNKFGVTPHQYILKSKLQLAKSLLRSTNKSIDEIATDLNFCDISHFSNIFLKNTGMRPIEYKKKNNP